MAKRALCIGINYVGTEYQLRGCVNDAVDWGALLTDGSFDVTTMTDRAATRERMVDAMRGLISSLKAGDTGAITYSGHGTWVPDRNNDEPDGRDEALVPCNIGDDGDNLIIDDELRAMFLKLTPGATLLWVTDCCHSGSVFRFFGDDQGKRRVRFVPPAHFIKTETLYVRMNRAFGQTPKKSNSAIPGLIHFSGCDDNEYSTDAEIDGRPCGAMTYNAIRAFKTTLVKRGTYRDAWALLRKSLPSWEFQQTPKLNATPALKAMKLFA